MIWKIEDPLVIDAINRSASVLDAESVRIRVFDNYFPNFITANFETGELWVLERRFPVDKETRGAFAEPELETNFRVDPHAMILLDALTGEIIYDGGADAGTQFEQRVGIFTRRAFRDPVPESKHEALSRSVKELQKVFDNFGMSAAGASKALASMSQAFNDFASAFPRWPVTR